MARGYLSKFEKWNKYSYKPTLLFLIRKVGQIWC